ncbi:MAG: DUF523 domain-containing protein [Gammaproteobacteria bacterium]|nr:DUF523 domain-containing protein [Gammaproteobacteria bacterium]
MSKILFSECLLGAPVRYDAQSKPINHPLIQQWKNQGRLVAFCPECSAGLTTPRNAAEIQKGDGFSVLSGDSQIITNQNENVSNEFVAGAKLALQLCEQHNIQYAILTAKSPSCGNELIYDGSFTGNLVAGLGVTAALLSQNGIKVFNQHQIDQLDKIIV